jgi:riboflavin kinase / FMN adenylyltransferase
MLGREYSLTAKVVRGDGLGRQLGFPTANLDVTGLVLPPHGVYAAHVRIDGAVHRAVLNIGIRPTVAQQNPQVRFEVHLLDFEADLYDQEIEVIYVEKLRDEKKFSSPAALREQIERDIAAARQLF